MKIHRVLETTGERFEPAITKDGRFQLADPSHGKNKHHAKFAVYSDSIEEVVKLIRERDFSLWMTGTISRQRNLISPKSIVIEE